MKFCNRCKRNKELDQFYRCKKSSDGRTCYCSECNKFLAKQWQGRNKERHLARAIAWAKENPSRRKENRRNHYLTNKEQELKSNKDWIRNNTPRRQEQQRRRILRITYNLSLERYEEMFKEQHGACALCGDQNFDGRRLAVDHDHKTGAVRALLCGRCNTGLGWFKEDAALLDKAIAYLKFHKSKEPV